MASLSSSDSGVRNLDSYDSIEDRSSQESSTVVTSSNGVHSAPGQSPPSFHSTSADDVFTVSYAVTFSLSKLSYQQTFSCPRSISTARYEDRNGLSEAVLNRLRYLLPDVVSKACESKVPTPKAIIFDETTKSDVKTAIKVLVYVGTHAPFSFGFDEAGFVNDSGKNGDHPEPAQVIMDEMNTIIKKELDDKSVWAQHVTKTGKNIITDDEADEWIRCRFGDLNVGNHNIAESDDQEPGHFFSDIYVDGLMAQRFPSDFHEDNLHDSNIDEQVTQAPDGRLDLEPAHLANECNETQIQPEHQEHSAQAEKCNKCSHCSGSNQPQAMPCRSVYYPAPYFAGSSGQMSQAPMMYGPQPPSWAAFPPEGYPYYLSMPQPFPGAMGYSYHPAPGPYQVKAAQGPSSTVAFQPPYNSNQPIFIPQPQPTMIPQAVLNGAVPQNVSILTKDISTETPTPSPRLPHFSVFDDTEDPNELPTLRNKTKTTLPVLHQPKPVGLGNPSKTAPNLLSATTRINSTGGRAHLKAGLPIPPPPRMGSLRFASVMATLSADEQRVFEEFADSKKFRFLAAMLARNENGWTVNKLLDTLLARAAH